MLFIITRPKLSQFRKINSNYRVMKYNILVQSDGTHMVLVGLYQNL